MLKRPKGITVRNNGQLTCFWCGGDETKPSVQKWEKLLPFADQVIVTDDNPRSEDPAKSEKPFWIAVLLHQNSPRVTKPFSRRLLG